MRARRWRDARAWLVILAVSAGAVHQAHLLHVSATAVLTAAALGLVLAWARVRHLEEGDLA